MAVAVNSVERRERLDVATDAIELEPLFGERARPGGSHFWGGLPDYKKNNVTAFPACDSRVRKCIFFVRFKECAMRKGSQRFQFAKAVGTPIGGQVFHSCLGTTHTMRPIKYVLEHDSIARRHGLIQSAVSADPGKAPFDDPSLR